MLNVKSYCLLNGDCEAVPPNLSDDITVITYGLHPKSTITASSIGEDEISICVQRAFKNSSGEDVLPQEITMKFPSKHAETEEVLCEAALSLVLGTF
ncbi:hypothetical protein FACS189425_00160 [Clostridia bacterium]|nr:hypothetical protein FACS189425_00160 [Clostridia bacterium]